MQQSERSESTRNSKFEHDLKTGIDVARESDQILVDLEKKFLAGSSLLDEELLEAAKSTNELNNSIKEGNKLAGVLKSWIKHEGLAKRKAAKSETGAC